jgi:uncharacterized protein DUF4350
MTVTATADGTGPTDATVVGPNARRVWRGARIPLLLLLVVLVAALLVGLTRARVTRGALDPDAVNGPGSRALAVLLGHHGITVHRLTTAAQAAAGNSAGKAVLVAFPERLPEGELRRIAGSATRLILVDPDLIALREVTNRVVTGGRLPVATREPGCDDAGASAAGAAELGGTVYLLDSSSGATSCYGGTLIVGRTYTGGDLVVLGDSGLLTNAALAHEGNAALALNQLGAGAAITDLYWLVPPIDTAQPGDRFTLRDLLPPWVPAAVLQLLVGGLLVVLWRSRRLGPPVLEPLPVVVRAAETVHGRARLYRRAQARDQAARALRAGALNRIVPRLRLGDWPQPAAVVVATAARTGRSAPQIGELLYGRAPVDDAGLVALADALDGLVNHVLRQ